MKRLFDIIASGIGLIILSPLFILIALLVKCDSKGPIFYRQKRVGKGNTDFYIFKFRSMHTGADNGSLVTIGDKDPRITRVGYILRRYKLDELPQLLNVFIGEMSIVGPRPEVRHYVDYWTSDQLMILNIRPGITDPASIKFRNESQLMKEVENPEMFYITDIMQKKLSIYQDYLKYSSFWYDIKLILLTFKTILTE